MSQYDPIEPLARNDNTLRAVIFDLDGTLLDTEPDFTLVLNRQLEMHGWPRVEAATVRKYVSAGAISIVKQGFGLIDDDSRVPSLLEEFLHLYSLQIPQTKSSLFDDIDLLIASLVDKGLSWGVMTNKHRRFSEPLVAQFENFATSGALVCPDDVGVGKPDPAGLLLVCQQLGVDPMNAIYVGDHPRDIEAAKNAGMPGIAVRWGYLPEHPPITAWLADHVADSPTHLLQLLQAH